MALINPQIVGMARVTVTPVIDVDSGLAVGVTPKFDFVNGFETATPTGAVPGASFYVSGQTPGSALGAGELTLFLDTPVDPGSNTYNPLANPPVLPNQGGVKAVIDLVGVSTVAEPTPVLQPDVEARWYYSDYNLLTTPNYQNVDPEKALTIKLYEAGTTTAYTGTATFDIIVFTNPLTTYK